MAAYRPLGQFNQYFLDNGTVNNGGSITFYETDLTTLKNTYSDPALTVLNSNPVVLAADGRLSTDVWGSGVYGAVIKDNLGTVIETRNNIQSGTDPGLAIPALSASKFLTNDGSVLLWASVLQVPDPTGFGSGATVQTDGTNVFWGAGTVVSGSKDSLTLGTVKIQTGTGTSPATNANTSSTSVVFPQSFSGTPRVVATANLVGGLTNVGGLPAIAVNAISSTGFNFVADANDYTAATTGISAAIPFTWFAIGPA